MCLCFLVTRLEQQLKVKVHKGGTNPTRCAARYAGILLIRWMLQRHGSFVYVVLLGARPEAQGQGLGSKLLRRITEYADSQGLPCYLEVCTGPLCRSPRIPLPDPSAIRGPSPASHPSCQSHACASRRWLACTASFPDWTADALYTLVAYQV